MSLLRKIALAATIVTAAGCSSYPDYDVKRRAQPLVADNYTAKPVEAPKEAPKETPKIVPKPAYTAIPFEVVYQAEDAQTAALIRGYSQLSGTTEFEAAVAADKDQNGVASFTEISDLIVEFTKANGGEIKLMPVKDGVQFKYSKTVQLPEKRASEMKKEFDSAKAYDKATMLKNWEKVYGPK
jgi:hypothetical protein